MPSGFGVWGFGIRVQGLCFCLCLAAEASKAVIDEAFELSHARCNPGAE